MGIWRRERRYWFVQISKPSFILCQVHCHAYIITLTNTIKPFNLFPLFHSLMRLVSVSMLARSVNSLGISPERLLVIEIIRKSVHHETHATKQYHQRAVGPNQPLQGVEGFWLPLLLQNRTWYKWGILYQRKQHINTRAPTSQYPCGALGSVGSVGSYSGLLGSSLGFVVVLWPFLFWTTFLPVLETLTWAAARLVKRLTLPNIVSKWSTRYFFTFAGSCKLLVPYNVNRI